MSEIRGKLINCARCNNMLFLRFLERTPIDGGISHYDKYQDLPKSWIRDNHFGHLCPHCASMFNNMLGKFFEGSNLAPAWQPQEDFTCEPVNVNLYRIKEDYE